jgi:hypothetical protein
MCLAPGLSQRPARGGSEGDGLPPLQSSQANSFHPVSATRFDHRGQVAEQYATLGTIMAPVCSTKQNEQLSCYPVNVFQAPLGVGTVLLDPDRRRFLWRVNGDCVGVRSSEARSAGAGTGFRPSR